MHGKIATRIPTSQRSVKQVFKLKPVVASLIAISTSLSSTAGRTAGLTVDEIDATRGWRINGDTMSAIEAIGDVNGDGLADVGITSESENFVSIIFGKSSGFDQPTQTNNLSGTDGFVIDLPGERRPFIKNPGFTLAGLGDFNGDGIDDFAVGSPNALPDNSGAVYVVFGRRTGWPAALDVTNMATDTGLTISGYAQIELGTVVTAVGDINNDSLADLMACTRFNTFPQAFEPCFVLFGQTTGTNNTYEMPLLPPDQGFTVLPGKPQGVFGFFQRAFSSSDPIGDINGDGIDDLALSTVHYYGARYSSPEDDKTFIIFGSETPPTSPIIAEDLTPPTGFVVTGSDYVSQAGDVNQDGIEDMFIGTHVLFGSDSGFESPLSLEDLPDAVGRRVDTRLGEAAFIGDINGDDIDDFAIGTPEDGAYYIPRSSGTVYNVFGNDTTANSTIDIENDLNGANGFQVDGASIQDSVGTDIAPVGDVNGDGIDDLAFGFSKIQPDNRDSGLATHILFGTTVAQPDYPDSCGPVFFDSSTSYASTYIWQDCPLGEPNGQWHIREAQGELVCPRGCGFFPPPERSYSLALKTDGIISDVELLNTESGDMFTQDSANQLLLTGNLETGSDELDGSDFLLQGDSSLCVNSIGVSVFYGAERRLVRTPIDLLTGAACVIDSPNPTVSLRSTFDAGEFLDDIVVTVILFPPPAETTTLKFATRGISATPGRDFYGVSRTLEFAAGESSKNILIQLRDDNEVEPAETFAIRAYAASNPAIEDVEEIVEFFDDDFDNRPTIQVSSATVNENDGFASITVSLSYAWDVDLDFKLFTRSLTATGGGVDYVGITRQFSILEGQTEQTVKIRIVDDELPEGREELAVRLVNTTIGFGGGLDVPLDDAMIYIVDDDLEP